MSKKLKLNYTAPLSLSEKSALIIGLAQYPQLLEKSIQLEFDKLLSGPDENLLKFVYLIIVKSLQNKIDNSLWPDIVEMRLTEVLNEKDQTRLQELLSDNNDIEESDLDSICLNDNLGRIAWFIHPKNGPLALWRNWQAKKKEAGEDLLSSSYISKLFKSFVSEKLGAQLAQKLTIVDKNLLIDNLDEILLDANKKLQIGNLDVIKPAGDENWMPFLRKKVKSQISFIDDLLDGGIAKREVGGILGYYRSGKTTLACQMLLNYGLQEYLKRQKDELYIPSYWYLFSYEVEIPRLQELLHSQLAIIPISKIRMLESLDQLSDRFGTQDYELKNRNLFHFIGEISERERFLKARELISKLPIKLVDALESEDARNGIQFIENILKTEASSKSIGGIIVDYVGAMVRLTEAVSDAFSFRQLLGSCPGYFRQMVAKPFNCIVWLFHQYSAETNRLKVKTPDHTYAAEARNFGEALDYCLCLSNLIQTFIPDYLSSVAPSGKYCRIYCSKARYTAESSKHKIVYFSPVCGQFIDYSHAIAYDPETGQYYAKTCSNY